MCTLYGKNTHIVKKSKIKVPTATIHFCVQLLWQYVLLCFLLEYAVSLFSPFHSYM